MKISEYVHALKIPFKINLPSGMVLDRFVYVYMIYGRDIYLIDSGVSGSDGIIFHYIEKTGRDPKEISGLILTHAHPDHIGAAGSIKNITGCAVYANKHARPWIEDTDLQFRERPIPGFHDLVEGPVSIDGILDDGGMLSMDTGLDLEVLHTPGHSNGSISLYLREEKILFSGDSIIPPSALPIYTDNAETIKSIEKLKTIEDIETLLSSWDGPRKGAGIRKIMDESIDYLRRIHETALRISENDPSPDPMDLCKKITKELGLPPVSVNPLVAASFMSSLTPRQK